MVGKGFEIVRGTIIGMMTFPYQFWTTKHGDYPLYLKPHKFAKGFFSDDIAAEAWVRENYPGHYADGVEMRCYDQ